MPNLPDSSTPPLGRRFRTIRRAQRLTQREVSERAGLAEPFLSRLENNRANPSLETLHRLAGALDVSLGDLIGAEPARFKPDCPVSYSGQCIAELIHHVGRRQTTAGEAYGPRQIHLLQLANYLVQNADTETLVAFETVMRSMMSLPSTRHDSRWLGKLRLGA